MRGQAYEYLYEMSEQGFEAAMLRVARYSKSANILFYKEDGVVWIPVRATLTAVGSKVERRPAAHTAFTVKATNVLDMENKTLLKRRDGTETFQEVVNRLPTVVRSRFHKDFPNDDSQQELAK